MGAGEAVEEDEERGVAGRERGWWCSLVVLEAAVSYAYEFVLS